MNEREQNQNKQSKMMRFPCLCNRAPFCNRCFVKRTGRNSFLWLLIFVFIAIAIFNIVCDLCKAEGKEMQKVIVIDAGHGGNDPGMVAGDVLEKDVNLSIAKQLATKLTQQGYTVVMTREEDVCLALDGAQNIKSSDLRQRVELINNSHADLLISIHQNCYTDENVCGAQVFYYGTSEQSEQFAKLLQANLIQYVDSNNHRQAKNGKDYYILKKSICPGVIVECGFLSCPKECASLLDPAYQNKIADAIVQSVNTYFR